MSKIELILASAGTGKTTRLARELEEALVDGDVRPEGVLATTFTRQAASELAERARTRLLAAGRPDDAHRLQAARIGTVNAVCGRLVEQFAFELGLSPDVRVIDEEAANRALREALSSVATVEDGRRLAGLGSRMVDLEWEVAVARIVAAARANGLSAVDLATSRDRSLDLARGILAKHQEDGDALDRALIEGMRTFVDTVSGARATDEKALRRCRRDLAAMENGRALPWREWATLSKLPVTKTYRSIAAQVQRPAAAHDDHPRFHADVLGAIELVFSLAERTLDAYETTKRRWGVIDFGDQEAHALRLLHNEDVARRLGEEIELVMVDEFQDTSPLQLAIFLKLAEIAPRSVWVGDPKQSIYGFRGTDPDLMDAALELLERRDPAFVDDALTALFEHSEPETLDKSWRSRPLLVEVTSDLFAAAFAEHGLSPERVKLTPGRADESAGLGPIIEVWDLQLANASRSTEYPMALAAGIDTWLAADDVKVRDRATEDAKPVSLSDLAVLSRRRATGLRVAEALESLGRRVVLPRPGLLSTVEGRLAIAALRRWADPADDLAAAEIDRITRDPGAPAHWLARLAHSGPEYREPGPCVGRIDSARAADPTVDPTVALQRCVAAVGLRELCRRWGESRQRLGNLDALRSITESFVANRASELGVASVPGLLAHFEQLADDEADMQAVLADDEAVTLSTWHAAKGLEWPVTILFDLDWSRPPDVTGVEVESAQHRLDLRDPLADRWIRYLPQPFQWNQRKTPYIERAAAHDFAQRARQRHEREQLRLLYVAWTRARDRLILAGPAKKLYDKILASLSDATGPLLSHPRGGHADWAGRRIPVAVRTCTPIAAQPRSTVPGHRYATRTPCDYPAAFVSPSSVEGRGEIVEEADLGPAITVTGVDPRSLGEAVHSFFAADDRAHTREARETFATEQLKRWGVDHPGLAAHLVTAADALRAAVEAKWPEASVHVEYPLWHRRADGVVVRGAADMVVETPSALAVIDHKALLSAPALARDAARDYAGQLRAYADAVQAATGRGEVGQFVHLVLQGVLLQLRHA